MLTVHPHHPSVACSANQYAFVNQLTGQCLAANITSGTTRVIAMTVPCGSYGTDVRWTLSMDVTMSYSAGACCGGVGCKSALWSCLPNFGCSRSCAFSLLPAKVVGQG